MWRHVAPVISKFDRAEPTKGKKKSPKIDEFYELSCPIGENALLDIHAVYVLCCVLWWWHHKVTKFKVWIYTILGTYFCGFWHTLCRCSHYFEGNLHCMFRSVKNTSMQLLRGQFQGFSLHRSDTSYIDYSAFVVMHLVYCLLLKHPEIKLLKIIT